MRKRIISLFLAVVLVFSVIPVSALAAVRDLLGNDPAVNQAILNELDALTGGSGAEAAAVLEQYGLLDENGQLNVDETINLNGEAMTLDEVMALLENPSTDLTEVGYVDGTPIALGDLKTIVEIEQELKRIQETYFSDRAFSGEAVENLNSLLDQMETSGISLQSDAATLSGQSGYVTLDQAVRLTDIEYNRFESQPFSLKAGREVSLPALTPTPSNRRCKRTSARQPAPCPAPPPPAPLCLKFNSRCESERSRAALRPGSFFARSSHGPARQNAFPAGACFL